MARAHAVLITCDICKQVGQSDDIKDTPEGWFRMEVGSTNGSLGTLDFCSVKCVATWSKERRNLGRRIGKEIECSVCGKVVGAQGIGTHMAMHDRETSPTS